MPPIIQQKDRTKYDPLGFYYDYLCRIKYPRRYQRALESAADRESALVNSRGILWEKSLTGRIDPSAEYAPMTAVRVPRNGELDAGGGNIGTEIFGVMAEQDAKSLRACKACEHVWIG